MMTIPGGNRERIGKWADFVYLRSGGVTHVRPFSGRSDYHRGVLCGMEPRLFTDWLGTGSQAEIDQARRMPLCIRCTEFATDRNA
jgi:hypothetical protein